MKITKIVFTLVIVLAVGLSIADANMKKGNVASGKYKGYVFSSYQNGPCTVDVIYDNASADIDVAMGTTSGGEAIILCMGVSTQKNHDSCTASVPNGTFVFIVDSYRGSSPFRVVVDCATDESIFSTGAVNGEAVREIQLDSNGKNLLQQLKKLQERSK